ncbi:hypothetical protein E2C01_012937 [Portunus trituberculatus]|uniref:Reverse transcriptase domain-containing protein n=1 Tax=Portunus trituberculatus TaxID=210409 RepID=A0A5B7DFL6_PORTR|nr:hypothetical protein [Portunus trituberculatus]
MDVYKRIPKLNQRSTTPTDLPIKLYKEFALELATPLCSILNASLYQYSCPGDSLFTPIPKTPSLQSLSDLRPVAITPIPSFICEDFVFDWSYNKISNSLDNQQFVAFVDIRKTFDLVDHTVVINKAISLSLSLT